jgi:hypothetical protein
VCSKKLRRPQITNRRITASDLNHAPLIIREPHTMSISEALLNHSAEVQIKNENNTMKM